MATRVFPLIAAALDVCVSVCPDLPCHTHVRCMFMSV